MITKAIADVTGDDLAALVNEGVEEGRQLEFKRELPGSADKDKQELCADALSFANTAGGYLLFGVDEANGAASGIPGLPGIDHDATILRLEQVLKAGIDPPIPRVACRAIRTDSGEVVVAVHVPRSWRAPHLVKRGGSFRMYARTSRGKQPLDAQEIRVAFESTGDTVETIRRWRDTTRLASILADETPVRLKAGAKMALHLVPLASIDDPYRVSAEELNGNAVPFQPLGVSSWGHRINLDGYLTHGVRGDQKADDVHGSYCQVFRSGRVEAVCADVARGRSLRPTIGNIRFEKCVLEATARYAECLTQLGVAYPLVVMLSFLEVRGAVMATPPHTTLVSIYTQSIATSCACPTSCLRGRPRICLALCDRCSTPRGTRAG